MLDGTPEMMDLWRIEIETTDDANTDAGDEDGEVVRQSKRTCVVDDDVCFHVPC